MLRRKAAEPPTDIDGSAALVDDPTSGKKGRPTPKRRPVAAPPPPAPKTRKEAVAWQRQHGSRAKVAGQKKMSSSEYREAVRKGDPRVLPKRDMGAVRALARDYVDSRRMLSNGLLLLFPLMIVGYKLPALQLVTLALFFLILAEWMYTGTRLRKMAAERGIEHREGTVSLGFYAGSRAYFPRGWRRPQPKVTMGQKI
jgi:hypothetical protein